ncbi:RNA-binding protein 5 [Galdieria sulphuraria]|nr:RNA-binding protein 5 [Galdieria sulphuraria]
MLGGFESTEQAKIGVGTTLTSSIDKTCEAKSLGGPLERSSEDRKDRAGSSTTHQEEVVPSNTIIVREIPNPVDSKSLKQFFTNSFGPVRDVRIPQSQFSTRSKSYGFVEFVRVETAEKVVNKAASDSVIYQGSKLEIMFASDGVEKKGWDCLSCGYFNFSRRRICKQCGAKKEINDILGSSQNKFVAGDAVLAAQWTASSQGLMGQSLYANYCMDPKSGWYYDPQTLYYVVDPVNLVFYDWSRQNYLQYNSATGTYIELASTSANPWNPSKGEVVSTSYHNDNNNNNNNNIQTEPTHVLEQVTQAVSEVASVKSDATTNSSEQVSLQDERQVSEPQMPSQKGQAAVTRMKPRGRILSNIQRWNQRRKERQQILEEFEESDKERQEMKEDGDVKEEVSQSGDDNFPITHQTEVDKAFEKKVDDSAEKVSNCPKMIADGTEQVFICELCRRKFKSNDILEKHIQFSELHRTNLQNSMYRDRAAERRQLHPPEDMDDSLPKKGMHPKKRSFSSKKASSSLDIENNIGAKLMKSMGWKEGQGLGREGSGSEPLNDPELRINPTDSQKERLRKETMLRWKMKFGKVSNEL